MTDEDSPNHESTDTGINRRTALKLAGMASVGGVGGQLSIAPAAANHGSFLHVLNVDTSRWPDDAKIFSSVNVDSTAGDAGDLTQDDFRVFEDGVEQVLESFSVSSPQADIVFVFDDTGSMGDEIAAMKDGVKDLTDGIEAAGTDARYGLVSFKDDVEVDQPLTDAATLKAAVDDLTADGGNDFQEDDFDAIVEALGLDFRMGAQKVIVDITDADSHFDGDESGVSEFTMSEVETKLDTAGAVYVAISPHPDDIDSIFHEPAGNKKILADNVGGKWFDINAADFSVILDELLDFLTSLYVLDWSTCRDPGTTVSVTIEVTDPGAGTGSHTTEMTIPPDAEHPPECAPTAECAFSAPGEVVTPGDVVTFDASASTDPGGDDLTFEWDFDGDGTTDATGAVVEHAFETGGTKTVTVTVTNEHGATDTCEKTVVVDRVPEAECTASFSGDVATTAEPVTFDASASTDPDGDALTFEWDFDGDGTTDATGAVVEHTFTTPGEKTVTVTVTDEHGASDTCDLTLTVRLEAVIDIKPCSDPNAINPGSRGVIPVGIKQTGFFDPTDPDTGVVVDSLRFGAPDVVEAGGGASPVHGGHVEDVVPCEGDGLDDLVVHFPTPDTGFDGDESVGRVEGMTEDGATFSGEDSVKLVGRGANGGGPGNGNGSGNGNGPGGNGGNGGGASDGGGTDGGGDSGGAGDSGNDGGSGNGGNSGNGGGSGNGGNGGNGGGSGNGGNSGNGGGSGNGNGLGNGGNDGSDGGPGNGNGHGNGHGRP